MLGAVSVFSAGCLWLGPGVTDDTFIHLRFASNLADHRELAFNPGEPVYGATSPLWIFALALGKKLGMWASDPVIFARLLAWLAAIGSILLMYRWVERHTDDATAWAAAGALAVDAWLIRWTTVGMESSFAVFFVLLTLTGAEKAANSFRGALLAAAAAALATLARPEAGLLAPIVILVGLASRPNKVVSTHLLTFALCFVLFLLPWLVYVFASSGDIFPLTATAKAGGVHANPAKFASSLSVVAAVIFSTQGMAALALTWGLLYPTGRAFLFHPSRRIALTWLLLLPAVYVLVDVQILSRYLLIVTPALVLLGFGALSTWTPSKRAREATHIVGLFVLTALLNLGLLVGVVAPPTRAFSRDLLSSVGEIAEWLDAHADVDAVVASPDIGLLGFRSRRRVLDLGGLISPAISEVRGQVDYESMLTRGRYLAHPGLPEPDYLLDRARELRRFADRQIRGRRFEPLLSRSVATLGIRKPGPFYYTLYRVVNMTASTTARVENIPGDSPQPVPRPSR